MGIITKCRYCGQEIEMMRTDNRKTVPCQREAYFFTPSGGPETFVTANGEVYRGHKDKFGEMFGHPKHARYCREYLTSTGRL